MEEEEVEIDINFKESIAILKDSRVKDNQDNN